MSDDAQIVLHRQPTIQTGRRSTRAPGDLTPESSTRHASAVDRRSHGSPDPADSPDRRLWITPHVFRHRPTSFHNSSIPARCWTTFNGLLRWNDCRLHHQRNQDTTGPPTETRSEMYVQRPPPNRPVDRPLSTVLSPVISRVSSRPITRSLFKLAVTARPSRFVAALYGRLVT